MITYVSPKKIKVVWGYVGHLNKNKCLINKCFIKLLDDEEGKRYSLFKSKCLSSKHLTHAN